MAQLIEPYLKLPMKILNIPRLSAEEKLYYAYIYSYSHRPKGCYATDEQIGKALGRKPRTIRYYQNSCMKLGLLAIESPGSPRRRLFAIAHPKYKKQPGHILPGTRPYLAVEPGQMLPTTIKGTRKETTKAPKKLYLEEQQRKGSTLYRIEQLKRNFGRGPCRASTLSAAEKEQRRQEQKRALLA